MIPRRMFVAGAAGLGAYIAASGTFAQREHLQTGAAAGEGAVERKAAAFAVLRLPGAGGLYEVMNAPDLREVRVARTEIEVHPGRRTPYLAYEADSGGKRLLNPALLARRGDEMRVRMVSQAR